MQTSKLQYNDRDRPMRVYARAHRGGGARTFNNACTFRKLCTYAPTFINEYITEQNHKVRIHNNQEWESRQSYSFLYRVSNTLCAI